MYMWILRCRPVDGQMGQTDGQMLSGFHTTLQMCAKLPPSSVIFSRQEEGQWWWWRGGGVKDAKNPTHLSARLSSARCQRLMDGWRGGNVSRFWRQGREKNASECRERSQAPTKTWRGKKKILMLKKRLKIESCQMTWRSPEVARWPQKHARIRWPMRSQKSHNKKHF